MSLGKRHAERKQQSEETCESMPRSVPKKIEQETVKLNYEGLTVIPSTRMPQMIRRLYLSHNKISTLKGIETFIALQSLNLSYNCLEQVQELRKIANPSLLKHLKIRMNPLPYGYQDYAVAIFPSLRSFEDIKLNKQIRQTHSILREYISRNILNFFIFLERALEIRNIMQENNENNINRSNKEVEVQLQLSRKEDIVRGLLNKLHKLYIFPTEQILSNLSITNLLTRTAQILRAVCDSPLVSLPPTQHYLSVNQRVFGTLFESILLKMSARYDKSLIEHLHSIQKNNPQINAIGAFRRLGIFFEDHHQHHQPRIVGGTVRSPSLDDLPAKYMKSLSRQGLKQHPMNQLVNWKQKESESLVQVEQTRWHNFYQKRLPEEKQQVDEQIPLFIYCKQYLQVITEIVLDQVSLLLQQQHSDNRQAFKRHPLKGTLAMEQQENQVNDEIQLELSLSDDLSRIDRQEAAEKPCAVKPFDHNQMDKETSVRQTIPKFKQKQGQNFDFNIQSYSLHEINLAFKVFRVLKRRVKKKKNRLHVYN